MLEITFIDGKVRAVTPQCYTTVEPFGSSLMSELELRLDDLSEGLFLEISHHRFSVEAGREHEGFMSPPLQSDVALMLLDANELERVLEVRWRGSLVIARIAGELVALSKVNALAGIYLSSMGAIPPLEAVARLYEKMRGGAVTLACGQPSLEKDGSLEDVLANEMGISRELFDFAVGLCVKEGAPGLG